MNLFHYLFVFLLGFYSIVLILILIGLFRLNSGVSSEQPLVSVVIAARNEEVNLPACLDALSTQSYPTGQFEIIIVDDRSDDDTPNILRRYEKNHRHFRAIHIRETPGKMAPKKWALNQGIKKAAGEIILTTDADCQPSSKWIESMVTFFGKDVGLVAGFSPLTRMKKGSLFRSLFVLDSIALAGVAAGSIGFGFPLTCNGRNLAYRKKIFEAVGGFDSIAHFISGDDDLFMHEVRKKTNWKIRYAVDKDAVVPSQPPDNLKDFIHQRLRHASKGKSYAGALRLGLAAVYLMNLSLILMLLFPASRGLFLTGFLLKSILEFFIVGRTAFIFRQKPWLMVFPLAAILHPFYVVIMGLWGQFGRFDWKGISYNTRRST